MFLFKGKDDRGEVPFLSHHIEGYQHDITDGVNVDHLSKIVFVKISPL